MKKIITLSLGALLASASLFGQKAKDEVINGLDRNFQTFHKLQTKIWAEPELGFLETKSAAVLEDYLKQEGFSVQTGVAGMPSAFVATYGSGKPVIGILAEYDALPGLSQDTVPYRKPLVDGGSGHGCGHHIFGVGSSAGAVAIKNWLQKTGTKGTIKVYGTPAEEGGGGKVYLARDGFFNDADIVLHWHPAGGNAVSTSSSLAIVMVDYSFHGIAAHASGSPERGRSALDGVESFDYMVNMMREHVPSSTRIHYIINNGGLAPNVVPDFAKVSYYIRSPKRETLQEIAARIDKAAEGAALGTGTTVTKEIISGFYDVLQNETLNKDVYKNLKLVGGVNYSPKEKEFAQKLSETLDKKVSLDSAAVVSVLNYKHGDGGGGSTDVGDVSWLVPTVGFGTAAFIPGSAGHSWQIVASGGTTIGTKALINAAKVFTLTAIDLYTNPKLVEQAKAEFEQKKGKDFKYIPLLGDRKPALDYRKK